MSGPYPDIREYALIGDTHSCALVSRMGSIDWACFPRFDSGSVFGRLLDAGKGGYFSIAPTSEYTASRRYLPETMVLETAFETASGTALLFDFMPVNPMTEGHPNEVFENQGLCRVVRCERGVVDLEVVCQPRFQYGAVVPHTSLVEPNVGYAHGGIDALAFLSPTPVTLDDNTFRTTCHLKAGERAEYAAHYSWRQEYASEHFEYDGLEDLLAAAMDYWRNWSKTFNYKGLYHDQVLRSALTLKALTYAPTGGIVAAATTSLPEEVGGERNWDYRYTWIRDATFAIYALNLVGFIDEADAFKRWLKRATAGRAQDLQIMYGLAGERRLAEFSLDHLEGYRGSRPVRIGNGAHTQLQLDIYGEVLDSAHLYRKYCGEFDEEYWQFCRDLVEFVIDSWREPDEGIWETRGGRKHFIFSKVMCWVALDRAIRVAEAIAWDDQAEIERWRAVREEIKEDVLRNGYDESAGAFVQSYGSANLDASVLMLPLVGFIKASDPRMRSTIEQIERRLTSPQGFVYRYQNFDDGLTGHEGTFTLCSFWLLDNLIYLDEIERAEAMMNKLFDYANDVGLFSEEIGPVDGEALGNFPQAFTHMAVINTAVQLYRAKQRRATGEAKQT